MKEGISWSFGAPAHEYYSLGHKDRNINPRDMGGASRQVNYRSNPVLVRHLLPDTSLEPWFPFPQNENNRMFSCLPLRGTAVQAKMNCQLYGIYKGLSRHVS